MVRNFIWDFFGKISGQLSSFIVSIILTRLLSPDEYGIMGMATVIIGVAGIFLNLGFSSAIVQQKEITDVQSATVFYINLILGIFLFLICFALAGALAEFYGQPQVKPIFRTLALLFIINSLNIVPSSLLYRQMKFKIMTVLSIISTIVSGLVGIAMAYCGYGVWSLVMQSIAAALVAFVLTQAYVKYIPLPHFSFPSIRPLWRYGSRLFASGFLDSLVSRLDIFIIGKIFTAATLGLYTRAQSMDGFVRQLSSGSIASVLFPYIAKYQDDKGLIKEQYLRYLHIIMLVSVGLGGFLYITAEDLFVFLFSERWRFSGIVFRIMSMGAFVWPVSNLMCTIISAIGNSKAFLRLEMYKKLLFIPVYAIGFFWGIEGFVYCLTLSFYIAILFNAMFVSREIPLTVKTQLLIMGRYVLAGLFSAAATFWIVHISLQTFSLFWRLALGSSIFTVLYLSAAALGRLQGLQSVIHLILKARQKIR